MTKPRHRPQVVDPDGLSIKEIAQLEQCSEEEIKSLLKSALQKLRYRAIGGNFPEVTAAHHHFRNR